MRKIYTLLLAMLSSPAFAAGPPQFSPSSLPGGLFLSAPATLQNGQTSINMMDNLGNLKVNIAGSSVPITATVTFPRYTPVGPDCKLTVTGATATAITSCSGGVPATANFALICNEGSVVRWSQTATPTTSTGGIIGTGVTSNPVCTTFGPSPNSGITALKFIEQTGAGTGTLDINFWSYN